MDTTLVNHPTIRPKDLKEWLGVITSALKDIKGTGNWGDNPVMTIAAIAAAISNDPSFGSNIVNLINTKFNEAKNYSDSIIQGIKKRTMVRASTTENITLTGSKILDGITLANGDKVLVKNQTDGAQNGIYIVNTSGAWVRDPEFDEGYELESAFVFVREGNTLKDTGWVMASDGNVNIGTTPINFTQFSAAGIIIADGTTLEKIGNTISLKSGFTTAGTFNKITLDQYGRGTGVNARTLPDLGVTDSMYVTDDLNNIISSGFYTCASNAQNIPITGAGYLIVTRFYNNNNYCNQIFIASNAAPDNIGVYTRNLVSGTWTAWKRIDPDPSIVVRSDKPTTMAKAATLSKIANNDSVTYTIIDADAKVYRAVYNDLAELFEHSEQTEPGDILISTGGKVQRSIKSRDRRVVGVHSDTYGFCLGGEAKDSPKENYDKFTPIGISGRVLVKVIGDVEEGQFITTSDIPGVGIATDEYVPGTIVGKALETQTGKEGIYRVWMLIMNT